MQLVQNSREITRDEVKENLKRVFWDVSYDLDALYAILMHEKEGNEQMSRDRIYKRLLGSFSWYQIVEIVPKKYWTDMLSDDNIRSLWPMGIRHRYERLKGILQKHSISTPG